VDDSRSRRGLARHKRASRSRVVRKDAQRAAGLHAELGAQVLEAAPVLILLLDAQGAIQYVNPFFERLTGYPLDEIRGKDWCETFLPPRDQAHLCALFRHSFEGKSVRGHVNPIVTRAGEERDIEWTDDVLLDASAHPTWLVIGHDVTERKAAQDALCTSEQRLAEAQRMARVGSWQLDLVTRARWWSDELYRIAAIPVGTPVTEGPSPSLIHPDDRDLFDKAFATALAEGAAELEFRIMRPDGEVREIYSRARTTYDETGKPILMAGINQDITERKRTQEAARRTSELLATVVAGAPIVLFAFDRNGRVTLLEGRALEDLGVKPGELVGASAIGLYAEVPGFVEAFGRALAGEQTVLASTVGAIEFEAVYAPSVDARGRIDGVIGVGFDVTERKRAEVELHASITAQQRLVAELRENDRRKSDFIAVLSHELRNPLSAIRNGLYVLDGAAPGGDQARRAAGIVDRQVAQLARLVDDLLDVSRITQDKIQLQRVPLDLDDLVRAVVDDYQAVFASRGQRLAATFAGAPVIVRGDAARLTQVIGNLLHNAAKFTAAGGLTRVSVAHDAASARAVLRVVDTGAGITPPMIEQVFQPFAQSDHTLARSMGGLGLGLTLVKGLVELHGGEVSVHSEGEGRGAEFVVRLPLDRPAERLAASPAGTAAARAARRVLVIEDNVDAAETLAALLELEGHLVKVAHDGATGIQIARELRPDLVLCDLGLPGMSGYDVARQLRADEALRSVRLVALSGYAAPEDVARARAAGFDQHLAKPVTLDRLRSVLEVARHQRGRPDGR
jgi:PAS domain S-box-containing protein